MNMFKCEEDNEYVWMCDRNERLLNLCFYIFIYIVPKETINMGKGLVKHLQRYRGVE